MSEPQLQTACRVNWGQKTLPLGKPWVHWVHVCDAMSQTHLCPTLCTALSHTRSILAVQDLLVFHFLPSSSALYSSKQKTSVGLLMWTRVDLIGSRIAPEQNQGLSSNLLGLQSCTGHRVWPETKGTETRLNKSWSMIYAGGLEMMVVLQPQKSQSTVKAGNMLVAVWLARFCICKRKHGCRVAKLASRGTLKVLLCNSSGTDITLCGKLWFYT